MNDGQNVFNQSIKNGQRTYDSIRKITARQGEDCNTGCLVDYVYFKNYYKMLALDLS